MSPIGMCLLPAMRAASNSHGSRTSSTTNSSPESCSDFSSATEISYSTLLMPFRGGLFTRPLRPAPLGVRLNSLFRVRCLHQLIQVDLLGPRQPLVEVNRVPRVERFLGHRQCGRTQLRHSRDTLRNQRFSIVGNS